MSWTQTIKQGIPQDLPHGPFYDKSVAHAPKRNIEKLSLDQKKLAVQNALRYFASIHHEFLAKEFKEELDKYGRIYMHRYRPLDEIKSRPISEYPAKCVAAAAIMLMIQNIRDPLYLPHRMHI